MSVLFDNAIIPPDYQGPAWVVVVAGALFHGWKILGVLRDMISAAKIKKDEEKLKKEAETTKPAEVPFIPESLEARIFRLEKTRLEDEMRELRDDNERLRDENIKLHDRLAQAQDETLFEQNANAELRMKLRRCQENERESRRTDPLQK